MGEHTEDFSRYLLPNGSSNGSSPFMRQQWARTEHILRATDPLVSPTPTPTLTPSSPYHHIPLDYSYPYNPYNPSPVRQPQPDKMELILQQLQQMQQQIHHLEDQVMQSSKSSTSSQARSSTSSPLRHNLLSTNSALNISTQTTPRLDRYAKSTPSYQNAATNTSFIVPSPKKISPVKTTKESSTNITQELGNPLDTTTSKVITDDFEDYSADYYSDESSIQGNRGVGSDVRERSSIIENVLPKPTISNSKFNGTNAGDEDAEDIADRTLIGEKDISLTISSLSASSSSSAQSTPSHSRTAPRTPKAPPIFALTSPSHDMSSSSLDLSNDLRYSQMTPHKIPSAHASPRSNHSHSISPNSSLAKSSLSKHNSSTSSSGSSHSSSLVSKVSPFPTTPTASHSPHTPIVKHTGTDPLPHSTTHRSTSPLHAHHNGISHSNGKHKHNGHTLTPSSASTPFKSPNSSMNDSTPFRSPSSRKSYSSNNYKSSMETPPSSSHPFSKSTPKSSSDKSRSRHRTPTTPHSPSIQMGGGFRNKVLEQFPDFDALSDSHIVFNPLSDSSDEDDLEHVYDAQSFNIEDLSLSSDLMGSKKFLEMHSLFSNRDKVLRDDYLR